MEIFETKYFDVVAHPEAEWPSHQNILIFLLLFHYLFSSTCRHNFGRTVARKSSIGGLHVYAGGQDILKIYI